jgi:hypothetical protein
MSAFEKCGLSLNCRRTEITPPSRTTNQIIEIAKSQLSRFIRQFAAAALFYDAQFASLLSRCGLIWIKKIRRVIGTALAARLADEQWLLAGRYDGLKISRLYGWRRAAINNRKADRTPHPVGFKRNERVAIFLRECGSQQFRTKADPLLLARVAPSS